MFYKKIFEQTGTRSAFLDHLEAQIFKNFRHPVAPSWHECLYRSAQKHSGYAL